MDIRKVLVDCEGKQGIPGMSMGNDIEIIPSGKGFNYIPENEKDQLIYTLIKEHCDIHFLEEHETKDIRFYPVPFVWLFAHDSKGNFFGTLEATGGIEDQEHPVVFINRTQKAHGKAAENLKGFLSLVNYYPDWQRIIDNVSQGTLTDQELMEPLDVHQRDIEKQKEIEKILSLSKDPDAIKRLIEKVRDNPGFVVYESKEEAEKEHEFMAI